MKEDEREEFQRFEAQIKKALLKADGSLWLRQMLIHYLTNKMEATATSQDSDKGIVPAKEKICKLACDHKKTKVTHAKATHKNRKVITGQLGLARG